MKFLNLSKDFNPFDAKEGSLLKFKSFVFSGGEPHIKFEREHLSDDVVLSTRINSFNDLGLLVVAVDALRGMGVNNIDLFMPYFPGARQDRRMVPGEPLTVKVYANLINSLGFNSVAIFDPHSDVTGALLNNVEVVPNHMFIEKIIDNIRAEGWDGNFNIVSPDAGANKKIKDLVSHLYDTYENIEFNIIKCDKTRDVKTGALTGFEIYGEHDNSLPTIVVDDICDGGGTFIGLADKFDDRGFENLYLAVSHGIFSKGYHGLESSFKKIYTTDSIKSEYFYDSTESKSQGVKPGRLEVISFKKIIC